MLFIQNRRKANYILLGNTAFNLLFCYLLYYSFKQNSEVASEGVWQIGYFGLAFLIAASFYLARMMSLAHSFSDIAYPFTFILNSFPLIVYGLFNILHQLLSWYFIPFPNAANIVNSIYFGGSCTIILISLVALTSFILAFCLNPVP